ncbi:MAG: (2Fe-2S)-binding protein [Deltaproteobacteria bacterium]|nr:(2Fe-2S)-binding protein [Deltaproteobacteria bacterium]
MKHPLGVTINGVPYDRVVESRRTLLDFLRDELGITGPKKGCDAGDCGCCMVLIDGVPMHSCLILAAEMEGRQVTTIEGLARGDQLHPVQEAFIRCGAVQCGFCIPGIIITAKAFLEEHPNPTTDEVIEAISGHLCRCTGYLQIVDAIMAAAEAMRVPPQHA